MNRILLFASMPSAMRWSNCSSVGCFVFMASALSDECGLGNFHSRNAAGAATFVVA